MASTKSPGRIDFSRFGIFTFEYSESHGVHGVLTGTAIPPSCDDCSSADRGWAFSSCKRRFDAAGGGLWITGPPGYAGRRSGISRTSRCCSRILTDDNRAVTSRISSSSSVVYSLLFSLFSSFEGSSLTHSGGFSTVTSPVCLSVLTRIAASLFFITMELFSSKRVLVLHGCVGGLTVSFELSSCSLFDFGSDGKFSSLRLSCVSDERSCSDEPA